MSKGNVKAQRQRHSARKREERFLFRQEMSEKQGGRCAICKVGAPSDIDHDHKTNQLRGVLCLKCNVGLGMFEDNMDYLVSAIEYLEYYSAENIH